MHEYFQTEENERQGKEKMGTEETLREKYNAALENIWLQSQLFITQRISTKHFKATTKFKENWCTFQIQLSVRVSENLQL